VVITPDDSLKTAVQSAISEYTTVQATVSNGVVTLTGKPAEKIFRISCSSICHETQED
jgi:hypothetical protein